MKKLIALAFVSAFAVSGFARGDEKPKTNEACKAGCKMADKDCPEKCMKSCADRAAAKKAPEAKK
ncbi:MAG TPA: hypothetical protein VJ600_07260 [Holophagaceae bacterium]|nr:hypothetical protein [Holophagaceae bacterium]